MQVGRDIRQIQRYKMWNTHTQASGFCAKQCEAALRRAQQNQWQLIRTWASTCRSSINPVNGNHWGISQLNLTASHISHFQFSYINWNMLDSKLAARFQTHSHKQKNARTKHTHFYTKSMTSFSLAEGEKEDILFVKLINIRSFRRLLL